MWPSAVIVFAREFLSRPQKLPSGVIVTVSSREDEAKKSTKCTYCVFGTKGPLSAEVT